MKRYEIHGADFCKMNDFMKELTNEGVKYNVIRVNGYFLDVEDEFIEKYEEMATQREFNIKQVDITEA